MNLISTLLWSYFKVQLFMLFIHDLMKHGGHICLSKHRLPPAYIHDHDVTITRLLEVRVENCVQVIPFDFCCFSGSSRKSLNASHSVQTAYIYSRKEPPETVHCIRKSVQLINGQDVSMSAHTTFGCTQKGLLWPDTRMNDDSANTVLSSQHRQCLAKTECRGRWSLLWITTCRLVCFGGMLVVVSLVV